MRKVLTTATITLMLLGTALAGAVQAQGLHEESLRIPMREAGSRGLEAYMVRPDDDLAHPLALVTHGTPREGSQRQEITALAFVPQAREFARRGWTTVIVVRRDYGTSGGGYAEEGRACSSHPDYYDTGKESARDLRASIAYLATVPHVDASRVLSVGVSAGGFANVALTADPPAKLVAAISFAGGRGSKRPDEVCNPNDLVRAFADFGRTSRVPMLWIYSENDHFFGPQLAAAFYAAFTRAGGKATFIRAAPFRRDGHGLFSSGGIPLWTPMVDGFLGAQNLQLRADLLPLPVGPDLPPPAALPAQAQADWRAFLTYPGHSAFAVSSDGHYSYTYARPSDEDARRRALERCQEEAGSGQHCELATTAAAAAPQ